MDKINTSPVTGTRDYLPEDVRFRSKIHSLIMGVFESYGFLPIVTPAIERLAILNSKYGEEGESLLFKIAQRGEKSSVNPDEALRYDLTVPFSRYVAEHRSELPAIFKKYQIAPVWRAEKPGRGRFREFFQCDIDIINSKSQYSDSLILEVISKALSVVGVPRFTIQINSRDILDAIMEYVAIKDTVLIKKTIITLDKLDKIGIDGVISELRLLLDGDQLFKIEEFVKSDLEKQNNLLKKTENGLRYIQDISNLYNISIDTIVSNGGSIVINYLLARGLDYYTGYIFETFLPESTSSIASGGRYDNLIGQFSGTSIPACGGSIGVDRLVDIARDNLVVQVEKKPNVFIGRIDNSASVWNLSRQIMHIAISSGVVADIYLGNKALSAKDHLQFAIKNDYAYFITIGSSEVESNKILLKELRIKKEHICQVSGLYELFATLVNK